MLLVVFNVEVGNYYSKSTFIMSLIIKTRETCVHIGYCHKWSVVAERSSLLDSSSGANFIELLSREFCLAIIFAKHFKTDYQPKYINFTFKFGW